ncbi:hypothetical protein BFW87_01255 [Pseudomonas fluorescens]|uniref:Fis family transcriptional regulator n=1 Tax=Pseudomonas fluorescens TaxID=294 RepID=A0A1T2Z8T7_PSEFL|nr:hypothetical protein [Pseudomonas fluorescens]OPB01053.1 hypothetical protein BFW87_01255 [Pseudomonas fluorescens]
MPSTKRDHARLERRLVSTLTEACETAKAEIPGFDWLTHTVDYARFPQSLRVTWVFDTRASKDHALASGAGERMRALTAAALHDAEVAPVTMDRCIRFDSEEECNARHGGDWRVRLAMI